LQGLKYILKNKIRLMGS